VVANVAVNCNSNLHGKSDVGIRGRSVYVRSRFALARRNVRDAPYATTCAHGRATVRLHVDNATYLRSNSQGAVALSPSSYDLSSARACFICLLSRAARAARAVRSPNCAGTATIFARKCSLKPTVFRGTRRRMAGTIYNQAGRTLALAMTVAGARLGRARLPRASRPRLTRIN